MIILIGLAVLVAVILVVVVSLFGDADATTLYYEKYGIDVKSSLKNKVVWITGASTGILERDQAFDAWLFRQISP